MYIDLRNLFQLINYGRDKHAFTSISVYFPTANAFINDLFYSIMVPFILGAATLAVILIKGTHHHKFIRSLYFIGLGLSSLIISQALIGFSIVSLSLITIGSFAGASGSYFDSFSNIKVQIDQLDKNSDLTKKQILLSEINYYYAVIISALLAVGAIIGVCMTILWGLNSNDYPFLVKGRISANLVTGYISLGVATLVWAIRPLVNCKDQLMDRL